ncbi:M81 family metallopeptidase [Larkinella terrae]|uniref:Microcystin degradation protein MlrC n=1 Tax=Larkinella terrae TaxID=2025311 RepID=A0A7K0EQH0_9BACT|nr:M81 family metallopeptidase [Larkinella terrae]MRS64075.1 microcystin degradation protein MlrC [Larkinella terrae]
MRKRVALLGIYHETNTFIETPTTLDDFKKGYWLAGDAIRTEYEGAHHEISGVIEVIDSQPDLELIPVFYVSATPGGMIQQAAYESILAELMTAIDAVLPLDGCIVVPHGAGVADSYPDLDGHWLVLLREKLGNEIPITGTLDPHANVSPAMVSATDALVAYATNPHVDQRLTGRIAAELMVEALRGNCKPVQHLVQLPIAISIEQQYTSQEPCRSLYDFVNRTKEQNRLRSASVLLGFPYADVPEMGSSFILVGDEKQNPDVRPQLQKIGQTLSDYILNRKEDFNGKKTGIAEVFSSLETLPKPILMLDMGDNVGGGAPGNSTHLLDYLEDKKTSPVFICLYDPQAVLEAGRYNPGESFRLAMGENGREFEADVILEQLSDGKFTETTPKHGGFVNYDMGETAIVKTAKGNTVMLTTRRTPPYSLRQLTAFGLKPESFAVIIAKGVNAPIAAYAPVCPSIVQVDTPGVTQADMTLFAYKNRREPMFPF